MIWIRDNLAPVPPVDAAIFDVDGVLLDDTVSYYATVKATVQHVVSRLHGRPLAESQITDADIQAFKAAGGFNDDWILSYTLCGVILNSHGAPPALTQIAAQSNGRGMPWVRHTYFPELDLSFELVERVCMEFFWGAEPLRRLFGLEAAHNRGIGFVADERALAPADFFDQLQAIGVSGFGIITGRSDIELQAGLETLGMADGRPFALMLDSTQVRKPDPAALIEMMATLQPTQALYIGDTADDLQLVLNYRNGAQSAIPCLIIIVAKAGQEQFFADAGADVILGRTTELPEAIQRISLGNS
jgi:HAD superfamily hydrolase (TIGR01548 family)